MESFKSDLQLGQETETEFARIFREKNFIVSSTEQNGKFSDYDVEVCNPDTGYIVTFEIKHDRLAHITSHVMVEVSKTINGKEQPSGLSASKSDLYVYKFIGDKNFYAIDTEQLRETIEKGNYKFKCNGGDGYRSNLVALDFKTFKKNAAKINEKDV